MTKAATEILLKNEICLKVHHYKQFSACNLQFLKCKPQIETVSDTKCLSD